MATQLTKDSSILIVGGGTWGNSTALHLARRGYKNVTLLEPNPLPSAISAGNDVNKMAGEGSWQEGTDIDSVHSCLTYLAGKGWKSDPVFSPYYHGTGYIVAASSPEAYDRIKQKETEPGAIPVSTAAEFRATMPEGVLTGDFKGWKGFWMKTGSGWVHARKAMMSAAEEAKRLGVKYITGSPQGAVVSLIDNGSDILGARTADGKEHRADRTILSAGANANQLFDFKNQLRPTAWTLAHIKMTPEETKLFKDLPVLFNVEKGFFMEPDEDRHELKMCDEHPGYCNWEPPLPGQKWPRSVPLAKHQIPKPSEWRLRDFLRDIMPQLAERPFSFARVCWCADTRDRGFLISRHPGYPSLVLASGDAGHGYGMIPVIGSIISDCLEGTMDPRFEHAYRWRPETTQEWWGDELCDRWGAGNKVLDLKKDVKEYGWTEIPERDAAASKLSIGLPSWIEKSPLYETLEKDVYVSEKETLLYEFETAPFLSHAPTSRGPNKRLLACVLSMVLLLLIFLLWRHFCC